MNLRRPVLLVAAVLFAALLIGGPLLLQARDREPDTTSLEGKAAPDFTLPTLDGKQVKLSDMKGSVVVVDFWATWCPPCRKSLPHIQALHANSDLAAKGLKVWAVNARETKDKIQAYVDQNKFTFTVPMDGGEVMGQYLVRGIPTTVVIGRNGTIKKVFVGFGGEASEKALDEAITAALAEAKPAT